MQSLLFPFPLYLPPICIWRLKSQQKPFTVQAFFSLHCSSTALLPRVQCIYTYIDTHVLRYCLEIFLFLSPLSTQNCLKLLCKTGPWASSCIASKEACFSDFYSTNSCQNNELNQQCHDLPQMLKPPLPHLHLTGMFLISPNGVTVIAKVV